MRLYGRPRAKVWAFYAYAEGQKSREGEYRSGQADGIWTSWDAQGEVIGLDEYQSGQLVNRWAFEKLDGPQAAVKPAAVEMHMEAWNLTTTPVAAPVEMKTAENTYAPVSMSIEPMNTPGGIGRAMAYATGHKS